VKNLRIFISLILCVSMFSILNAQQLQTGTIRGTITDDTGAPLPGVNVTVKGPSLIGSSTDISDGKGLYRIPALPPGKTYTITFKLQGFKTLLRKNVIIRVGMTIKVNITMELATIEEEVTVVAPSPTVDVQSNKLKITITKETMMNLPLNRNLMAIIGLTPGTSGGEMWTGAKLMHGGTEISTMFMVDGVNNTDPDLQDPIPGVEYEAMEEVEIVIGGLMPQIGHTSGAFINVVTKSGGNDFSGMVQTYYTSEGLNQVLFTDEELNAYNISKPGFPVFGIQNSAAIGGPIIKDKLWFFSTVGLSYDKYVPTFMPTTILGKKYEEYQNSETYYSGFLKLTASLTKNLRFFLMGNYNIRKQPHSGAGRFRTEDYSRKFDQPNTTVTGNLSWIISPDTILDIRGGWNDIIWHHFNLPGTEDNFAYRDQYTGYRWGSNTREQEVLRWTYQASTTLTHFQDNFLGGDHEIKIGAEIYYGVSDWFLWRNNPIRWDFYDGSPWYYRGLYDLDGPHETYGDGRIIVQNLAAKDVSNRVRSDNICLTAFFQDTWTIADRLTLNIGFRIDDWNGWIPLYEKGAESPLAVAIGADTYLQTDGFNPFDAMPGADTWKDAINWTAFSPRLGIAYDLFGDGKTALKASYSRYVQVVGNASWQAVSPYRQKSLSFYWWDLNNNGDLDAPPIDNYVPYGLSPAFMLPEYYLNLIDPDISGPINDEFILAVNHELMPDLNVGVQYIYKKVRNEYNGILYDVDTDRYWNTYEKANDWWIPFTTIVPGVDDFPEETVTMYFLSNDAPAQTGRLANVPEAKKKYQALEFTFAKRMSNSWSLGGSVVFSKLEANQHDSRGSHWGWSSDFYNANYWVNRYGRMGHECPLMIKLYGTVQLPLGFLTSFYYSYFDGYPWQRTVSVAPPKEWADANNASYDSYRINVEPSGTRRYPAVNNLDFRLEKELNLDFGRLGLFVDIYNLLGHSYLNPVVDPGGTWSPTAENTNLGTYSPSGRYKRITDLSGIRTFKFSFRFSF